MFHLIPTFLTLTYVRIYNRLWRDSGSFWRYLFTMSLNSISLKSLRKSSFGLHIKRYIFPSDPFNVIRRGLWSDGIIATLSSIPDIWVQFLKDRKESSTLGRTARIADIYQQYFVIRYYTYEENGLWLSNATPLEGKCSCLNFVVGIIIELNSLLASKRGRFRDKWFMVVFITPCVKKAKGKEDT